MRVRTAREIGALIRDRRGELKLTQEALAARARVSRRWLASVEAGKPGVELGMVLRVLAVLGVELDCVDRRPPGEGSIDLDELVASYERSPG